MSYKAQFYVRSLFGDYAWEGNRLRFATEAEAQAHIDSLLGLLAVTDNRGTRVVESDEAENTVWDFDAQRYSPAAGGLAKGDEAR